MKIWITGDRYQPYVISFKDEKKPCIPLLVHSTMDVKGDEVHTLGCFTLHDLFKLRVEIDKAIRLAMDEDHERLP